MLKIDTKQVTKNLQFNLSLGSVEGKKVVMPIHKTPNGITNSCFFRIYQDLIKIIFKRRIYLQQVPNGDKLPGVVVEVDSKRFEQALIENEEFFQKNNNKEVS